MSPGIPAPRRTGRPAWLMVALLSIGASAAGADRPNVIVVMTDDQGYGEFSCNGNPVARTLRVDRLAGQSARLTDFHVSPMCTPTRGQLMSGLDAFRNGAMNVSSGRTLLRPELMTMADVFRSGGYRTGTFGKWHLGDNAPFRPEDRGFDEAIWFPSSHIGSVPDYWNNDYFEDTYCHNSQREHFEGYCTDVFFHEAIRWIGDEAGAGRPFFVYLPLNAAHAPWFVPDVYRDRVRNAIADAPGVVEHLSPERREGLVSYLAMGLNIDENVGSLIDFLDREGLAEDTILVFLTDNGSTMGPDYYNAGMRGRKTTLWEGGHRVPCFVRWPGEIEPGLELDQLTHVQDLLPTLADLAGVDPPPYDLDGISLAPVLRGEADRIDDRMLVINYSRMPSSVAPGDPNAASLPRRDGAAVLWKRWRMLEGRSLYDLDSDPHQDRDVAAEHPEVMDAMRAHLDRWWDGVKDLAAEPQRVVIGSDAEDPLMLTACEWLDVFVDQQRQIRGGVEKNGVWHLRVDRPGRYRFALRRWPAESGLALTDDCPALDVTDGTYPPGRSLPIADAMLRIGETTLTAVPAADGRSITFEVDLPAGDTELQTWMRRADGSPICGAYYVYVDRL